MRSFVAGGRESRARPDCRKADPGCREMPISRIRAGVWRCGAVVQQGRLRQEKLGWEKLGWDKLGLGKLDQGKPDQGNRGQEKRGQGRLDQGRLEQGMRDQERLGRETLGHEGAPFDCTTGIEMTGLTIRAANPDDADAVGEILRDSYPALMASSYENSVLDKALPLIVRPNPALLGGGTYYIAVASNGLRVGCGGWTREAPGTGLIEPGLAHLRHFATRAGWVGQGIGRSLYRQCAQAARNAGMASFLCYSNLNAVPFYAALGFGTVGPRDIPLGGTVLLPAMVMRLDLDC